MNQLIVRYSLVGASLVTFFWAGCSSDEPEAPALPPATSTTSGMGSTGTGVGGATGSTSVSSTIVSTSASSTTGGGTGMYECNPVTNEPCAAGDACDLSQDSGFICFPPPNEQNTCEACDNQNGPFCQGTMTCAGGICAKYCCTSDDCGPSADCVLGVFTDEGFPEVGICDAMPGGGTGGGGGAGGAGGAGGGTTGTPGCDDVPAAPPSNGSCLPFP